MTRIVFASCISTSASKRQPVWIEAAAHEPDWLFLCGDNIYMDYFPNLNQSRGWSLQRFVIEMGERYAKQFAVPSFRKLVGSIDAGKVVGVWDDHDFAWNNAHGADPSHGMVDKKRVATAYYHHYFTELNRRPLAATLPPLPMPDPANPPRGTEPIHRAFDLPHATGTLRTLLCDVRSHRGKHPPGSMTGDLLGPAQEAWLLAELAGNPGPFLLVSGSTMTAGDDQSWDYFPEFFVQRFLPATQGKTVIFLGGDVHENRLPPRVAGRPIEIVSSAAVLDFPFNKRNFGVIELKANDARVFLYRRGKVQYTGHLDLATGSFRTSMAALADDSVIVSDAKSAATQRAAALRKLTLSGAGTSNQRIAGNRRKAPRG